MKKYLTIGDVVKQLDVPSHVLRFWEKEFTFLTPHRINNRRYYATQQLEVLQTIKTLLYQEKYTIAGVKRWYQQQQAQPDIKHRAAPAQQAVILPKLQNLVNIVAEFAQKL